MSGGHFDIVDGDEAFVQSLFVVSAPFFKSLRFRSPSHAASLRLALAVASLADVAVELDSLGDLQPLPPSRNNDHPNPRNDDDSNPSDPNLARRTMTQTPRTRTPHDGDDDDDPNLSNLTPRATNATQTP